MTLFVPHIAVDTQGGFLSLREQKFDDMSYAEQLKTPSLVSLRARLNILGTPVVGLMISYHVCILCIVLGRGEGGGQLPEKFEEEEGRLTRLVWSESNN